MRKIGIAEYMTDSCVLTLVVDEEENIRFIASIQIDYRIRNIWV